MPGDIIGIALAWIARTFSQTLEDDGAVYGDVVRLPVEAKVATLGKPGGRGAQGGRQPTLQSHIAHDRDGR